MSEYQSIHTGQAVDDAVSVAHTHTNKSEIDSFDLGQVEGRQGNTGFLATALPDVAFDNATRTFTVSSPVEYTAEYWIQGVKHLITDPITFVIPDTEGMHYLYIQPNGTIGRDANFSGEMVYNNAYVTAIYWDATNKVAVYRGDERHTTSWHRGVHLYRHATSGAAYSSGFTPQDYIADGNGSLNTHASVSVGGGVFYDEDIRHVVSSASSYRIFYRVGSGLWRVQNSDYPVVTADSGRAAYNEFDGNEWSQQEAEDGWFVLAHILITNDLNGKVIVVQGVGQYDSIGQATTEAQRQLIDFDGLPFQEMIPVATLVYETRSSYTNAVKSRLRTNDLGYPFIDWRDSENNILMSVDSTSPIIFQLIGEQNKSIGLVTQPTIDIDTVNHTVSLGECRVFIGRLPSFNDDSPGRLFTVPPAVFNTTDQTTQYIKIHRTDNAVAYIAPTSDDTVASPNRVDVARIIRTGPVYHVFRFNTLGLNLANKLEIVERDEGFKIIDGLGLAAVDRVVTVGAGVAALGATLKTVLECISNVDNIRFYTWNGVSFAFSMQTLANHTQYNGDSGLVTMANDNRYNVNWFWRGVEDQKHIYSVLSRSEYSSIAVAEQSQPPEVPQIITDHAVFVGGIVYQRNNTTPVAFIAPAGIGGAGGTVSQHNNLGGIQGGAIGERYHISENQYNNLVLEAPQDDKSYIRKNGAWLQLTWGTE